VCCCITSVLRSLNLPHFIAVIRGLDRNDVPGRAEVDFILSIRSCPIVKICIIYEITEGVFGLNNVISPLFNELGLKVMFFYS
jgi:hypothetical protein